jgi:hypothetical protein
MDTNLGGDFKCGMIVSRIYICTLSKKNRVTPPSEHRDYKWKKVHHKPVKNDFDTITRFGFLNNKSILITGLDRFLPKSWSRMPGSARILPAVKCIQSDG